MAKKVVLSDGTLGREIKRIVVHCSATSVGEVKSIRQFHVNVNKWADIGYHFLILNGRRASEEYEQEADGLVEVGRPMQQRGAHCPEANSDSIGICLIGVDKFTVPQIRALKGLVLELMRNYELMLDDLFVHRDFESARKQGKFCPGFSREDLRGLIRNL